MHLVVPPHLPYADALTGLAGEGLVVAAAGPAIGDDGVHDELGQAFEATRAALRDGRAVVYVVAGEDLLGQRGAPAAMVACGLLSGARTAALEGARGGVTVNVVAAFADADPGDVATWVGHLLSAAGVNGEVVRVGSGHLGKALP